jgi:pentafunctional AROM polypeptide
MSKVQTIQILGTDSIKIGKDITDHIAQEAVQLLKSSCFVIVTDENVAPLHLAPLLTAFEKHIDIARLKSKVIHYIIPPGEIHKTRQTKEKLEDWMLEQKCTRETCILALGGGVIGDLVGYTAATFMRGIPIIQVPTTLLAMVDSSVGGKTAIDTAHGKNLIGAFHQVQAT